MPLCGPSGCSVEAVLSGVERVFLILPWRRGISNNPAAGIGVMGAVRMAWGQPPGVVGPRNPATHHWRLPRPQSSAYVSIQVRRAGAAGSHKLLTAETLVVHE